MRFAKTRPRHPKTLIAWAALAAVSATCLATARGQVTVDITGQVGANYGLTTDSNGDNVYNFGGDFASLQVQAGVPIEMTVEAVPSAQTQYWTSPSTWGTAGYLLFAQYLGSYADTIAGAVQGDPVSILDLPSQFNTLADLGPTERSISIPGFELQSTILPGILDSNLTASANLEYDVLLPAGSTINMDQSNVIVQSLTIQSGATLTANSSLTVRTDLINQGTLQNLGGTIQGDFNNSGPYADIASSLTVQGAMYNSGALSINSGVTVNLWQPFINMGTLNLYGGTINAPGPFINNGTIYVAGDTSIGIAFNNTGGTISVASGTLYLSGGGTSTGGTIAAGNGVINFSGGTQTLSGTWTGAGGTIAVSNGNLLVASGSAVVLANTAIQITGGSVGGDGTLSVNGGSWTTGTVTGAGGLINTGVLAVDPVNGTYLDGVLTNAGTIIQGANANGAVSVEDGTINNPVGTTYDIQSGSIGSYGNNPNIFNNAGLLEKTSNAKGDSSIQVALNNTGGTISVASGTLYLSGGGTSTGGTIAAGNGVINFSGGTQTLSGTWTGAGGTIAVSNGNLLVASGSAVVLANTAIQITGGSVGGDGTLSVNGGSWTTGTVTGAGGLINTGVLAVDPVNGTYLDGVLTNAGTIIQGANANGAVSVEDGTINNPVGTTYDIQSGSIGSYGNNPNIFNNAGLLEKTSNAKGDSSIQVALNNTGGTISVASGTLYLSGGGTSTGGTIAAGNGVINFSGGTQTLSGTWTGAGGTIAVSNGNLLVASGSAVVLANTAIQITGGSVGGDGTLSVNGGSWTTGTVTGAGGLINTGVLAVDPVNGTYLDGVLTNAGTIIQGANANGAVSVEDGTINNPVGTTYDIQSGSIGSYGNNPNIFNNAGLLEKTSNAKGDSSIQVALNNTGGTISVASGTLYLSGGGTSTGGTIAAGNGVINFSGGTQTLSGTWTGAGGTIAVSNGNLLVASGSAVVLANTAIQITGGSVGGDGTLSVNGGSWTTGTVTGAGGLINTGVLAVDPVNGTYLDGVLTNAGTIIQGANANGAVSVEDGTINNPVGTTYDIQSGSIGSYGNNPNIFNNAGLLEKTSNAKGDSSIQVALNNTGGTISVASGTLYLSGGGTSTGGTIAAGNGVINFSGGTQTLSGTWTGAGGTIAVSNGNLLVASGSAVVLANTAIQITGGSVGGDGTLSVNGGSWTTGTVTGAGGLINTGVLAVDPVNGTYLDGVLTNAGTIIQGANANGAVSVEDGTINNPVGTTYDIQSGSIGSYGNNPNIFNNAGLLEKTSNAKGDSSIQVALNNTGTVEVDAGTLSLGGLFTQTAGTTNLNGGNLSFSSTAQFQGGSLAGSGTITGSVSNTGATVSPGHSPGTIAITGNYTQGTGGILLIELAGKDNGEYDVLNVSGNASLGGTLEISFLDGFQPTLGDNFSVLDYGSFSGTFSTVEVVGEPGYEFAPEYTGSSMILTTTAVPEPASLFLLALGGAALSRRRRREVG